MPPIQSFEGVVFPPLKKYRTVGGFRGKDVRTVLVCAVVFLALFFALGQIYVESEVEISPTDELTYRQDYNQMRLLMGEYETAIEETGTDNPDMLDFTEEEQSLIAEAKALGITSNMSDSALEDLIPQTEMRTVELFPTIPRFVVVFLIPTLTMIFLHLDFEHKGSAAEGIKRFKAFAKRQRFFVFRKSPYLWGDK